MMPCVLTRLPRRAVRFFIFCVSVVPAAYLGDEQHHDTHALWCIVSFPAAVWRGHAANGGSLRKPKIFSRVYGIAIYDNM